MSNTPESPPPLRTNRLPADEDAPPFPNPAMRLFPFISRVAVRRGLRTAHYLDEGDAAIPS